MNVKYKFKNEQLLKDALTHSSCMRRHRIRPSERLEFLGDSVLGLCMSLILYETFPSHTEGEMSVMLANLVSTKVAANIACSIGLDQALIMDIGEEQSGGRRNINNLENAMESLLAAIFLDSNFNTTKDIITNLWQPYLSEPESLVAKNPKSILQEIAQQKYKIMPTYTIVEKTGSSHAPSFIVRVEVVGLGSAVNEGKSLKEAQICAAQSLLKEIE